MYFKLLLQMGHLWFLLQPGLANSLSFILCCGGEEKETEAQQETSAPQCV